MTSSEQRQHVQKPGRIVAGVCLTLLALFALLSWVAAGAKCATADEPLHATSAYLTAFHADYRIDCEDPPLWKYWAMLPHRSGDLFIDRQSRAWDQAIRQPLSQSLWCGDVLYRTPRVDGAAFIERSRAMMLIIGIVLGGAIAFWSWRAGGAAAAIVATVFYSFDPTVLGHSPLVKNDVFASVFILLFMLALYESGRRLSWAIALSVGLALGAGLTTKFSAILLLPMMLIALFARAMLPMPWRVLGITLVRRDHRALAALGLCVISLLIAWGSIWAAYRFRFVAAPDGSRVDSGPILQLLAEKRFYLHHGRWPIADESQGWEWTSASRLASFAERQRLLPQAWIAGFLFTYQSALVRPAFLLGRIYDTGCWYYFPLVLLFKMPLATLLAMGFALSLAVARIDWSRFPNPRSAKPQTAEHDRSWLHFCLWIPIVVYGVSAIRSNVNLGIRHLLPIMPFVFILIGVAAASCYRWRPRLLVWMTLLLSIGLMVETLAAMPDFLAFFNVASGGKRGGLNRLGDSNLDWGQDLPALVVWQQQNPKVPLYLLYFGIASVDFYGIRTLPALDRPCTVAISATMLQGLYLPAEKKDVFQALRMREPTELLGGSIYLYRYPEDFIDSRLLRETEGLMERWRAASPD